MAKSKKNTKKIVVESIELLSNDHLSDDQLDQKKRDMLNGWKGDIYAPITREEFNTMMDWFSRYVNKSKE